MRDLHKLVIPKVAAEWKKVADYLRVDQPTIDLIEEQYRNYPAKCCTELFRKWLNSNCGQGPKCWSTLITVLKEIEELTAVTEEIEQALKCKTCSIYISCTYIVPYIITAATSEVHGEQKSSQYHHADEDQTGELTDYIMASSEPYDYYLYCIKLMRVKFLYISCFLEHMNISPLKIGQSIKNLIGN